LRLGCITGSAHAGVKLHGFLSYLVKSLVHNNTYTIIGYKGKQVRDQIHAYDLARAFNVIIQKPGVGEVFNMGGGRENAASIVELIALISNTLSTKPIISYLDEPRQGDHQFYVSDLGKFRKKYPQWDISYNLEKI